MFESSALLVIDLQPIYTNGITDLQYPDRVMEMLSFMRQTLPASHIVHIRANYVDSPMRMRVDDISHRERPSDEVPAPWAVEMLEEPIFKKSTVDGFHSTHLDTYLKEKGISRLYCMGMLTSACVHSTAVGGMNRGFECILIEEACIDKTPEHQASVFSLYKDHLYQTVSVIDLKTLHGLKGA